jgi:hypothetical protein
MTPLRLDLTDEWQLEQARRHHPLDEAAALAVSPATSSPEAAETVREDEASAVPVQSVLADAPRRGTDGEP